MERPHHRLVQAPPKAPMPKPPVNLNKAQAKRTSRAGVSPGGGGGLPSLLRFGSTTFEPEPYDEDVIPGFWHVQRYRKRVDIPPPTH
jgi:hypothetical protein